MRECMVDWWWWIGSRLGWLKELLAELTSTVKVVFQMDIFLIVTRTGSCEAEVDNVGEKKLPQFLRSCYSAQHPGQDIVSAG